jgi:hypothetical protein
VKSAGRYRGFMLVGKDFTRFYGKAWPIDRASKDIRRYDLDDPLKEVDQFLMVDEDRLILRVNRGVREIDISVMQFDLEELEENQ